MTADLVPPLVGAPVVDIVAEGQSVRIPVSPFAAGEIAHVRAAGVVRRRVWQIPSEARTTLQLLAPWKAALEDAGYETVFECAVRACGGFAFRFETETLPAPEMFVDLGDYRFVAARRGAAGTAMDGGAASGRAEATDALAADALSRGAAMPDGPDGTDWATLMVSRSATLGFVQLTEIAPARRAGTGGAPEPAAAADSAALSLGETGGAGGSAMADGGIAAALESRGHVVLDGLAFVPGSSELGPGPIAALAELAAILSDRPEMRIILVGHTDADGTRAANIALSERRAAAVRDRLIAAHGVDPDRVDAAGVGYLAPLASNATAQGRERNRRVEAVLDRR